MQELAIPDVLSSPGGRAGGSSWRPLDAEGIGFAIVYAASRGGERVFDMEPARRLLGYEAQRALARGAALSLARWGRPRWLGGSSPPASADRACSACWAWRGSTGGPAWWRSPGRSRRWRWRSARWAPAASPSTWSATPLDAAAPAAALALRPAPPAAWSAGAAAARHRRGGRSSPARGPRRGRLRHGNRGRPPGPPRPGPRAARRASTTSCSGSSFRFFSRNAERLDHQPRHRRRAVGARVRRRRAAAGRRAAC